MPIGANEGELITLLVAIYSTVQSGITISGLGWVSYSLTRWLSHYTQIDEPDPTIFLRLFEMIFDQVFAPIGLTVSERVQSPMVRKLSFLLSIGVAVILIAFMSYLATAGLLAGGVLAVYQTYGFVINPVPVFREIVACIVVIAMGVMFHAEDRANQKPV